MIGDGIELHCCQLLVFKCNKEIRNEQTNREKRLKNKKRADKLLRCFGG